MQACTAGPAVILLHASSPGTRSPRWRVAAVRAVGVGTSAGGLAAIGQFLAQIPPDSGLAYVVVQHLDPTHKAMLVELLQRITAMPVFEAAEAMRLQPNVVYVIPPPTAT